MIDQSYTDLLVAHGIESLPETPTDRHATRWKKDIWPGVIQMPLKFIGFQIYKLWQLRRSDLNGGPALPPTGMLAECIKHGPFLFIVCPVWLGPFDSLGAGKVQDMESEKQVGEVQQSLRQTRFQTFIQEFITRVGKFNLDRIDDELVRILISIEF